ncbi:cadherin-like beta sandwich domain-containing protein [Halanaerobium praevalens]|uniref:Coagulation factor 5/8 type domain protein n=1 Tax=Halanaerobium praevalens (strain ATCC 33744 / DSM 2228 / GSL) TaxID=572479 RepID=E3DM16_HALPG|nr:cadherin-like beta sandwich domain-containing protein [Halanaerobium praevalens]ADO77294.1 coagulation factor 5/8 type domain protein [Halanaerobium praevalens DSM 2228]
MKNLVLKKNATANNFVKPYSPNRAVDGSIMPIRRWLADTVPTWIAVDMGAKYWIGSWRVRHMPIAGWPAEYVISDFKLQGSFDLINWFDIDSVSNNTSTVTSREFTPVQARYVRFIVMKGLQVNPHLASLMDLAVYETAPPVSADLANLSLSDGELSPSFTKDTTNYTADVDYDTDSIRVTPRAEDARATIKVNGIEVESGQASQAVNLSAGATTTINVEVIGEDGESKKIYTVEVTRKAALYLDNLIVKSGFSALTLSPEFDKRVNTYTTNAGGLPSVNVIPTSDDGNIKVNGSEVISGQLSSAISLSNEITNIRVDVISSTGDTNEYIVKVSKNS